MCLAMRSLRVLTLQEIEACLIPVQESESYLDSTAIAKRYMFIAADKDNSVRWSAVGPKRDFQG